MNEPPITKAEYVYNHLKADILAGRYQPEEKLIVSKISKEYHVSSMPVREAIKNLSDEGFVIAIPNCGAKVHVWDYDEFNDLMQISTALEMMAARMAAYNISPEGLEKLQLLYDQMVPCVEENNLVIYKRLNKDFHSAIFSESGNPSLSRLIENYHQMTYPYTAISFLTEGRLPKSIRQHQLWLNALKCGDGATSEFLCFRQRVESYDNFLNHLEACLEQMDAPEANYYIYGFASTFAHMTIPQIREKISGYRRWIQSF